ncbi:MAG: ABC transporter substrate-binding protein [Parcubacteria group bacterium]
MPEKNSLFLTVSKWLKINKTLNLKEKFLFYFLWLVLIGSTISCAFLFYHSKTKAIPAYGGEYIEGIVGQPAHINPLLSSSNETDADMARLIYSGLFKYDSAGQISPDLASGYDLSEDKTTYTVHLRENVVWHDNEKFNADDVAFTINLLSDPVYKSPLRSNWQGIQTSVLDDRTIQFKIDKPYVGFLSNLVFGILPKHLWNSITPSNFALNPMNLKPIGTGPYKYDSVQKDSNGNIVSYKLISNPAYFTGKPYISKMTFNFYADEDSVLSALNRKEIMGIGGLSSEKLKDIKVQKSTAIYDLELPRYFAVFFNQTKSIPVASDEVRAALSLATDRQEIINAVLDGNGRPAFSPFLPGMIGYSDGSAQAEFNTDKANQLLDSKGWNKGADGWRAKDETPLEIDLVTTDWSELTQTANLLKSQWEKIGVKVNISSLSITDVQENYIRPREYEALLFGQVVGADPDPFSFWHSSEKKDPGLNLSLFGDDNSDKLIDDGRMQFDTDKRTQDYIDLQKIITDEIPAIFLYSPSYIYPVSRSVQGINLKNLISPAGRFSDANNWYIKTKRISK